MSKERVLKKVQKLLALSQDNPNENESQSAMLMAQKMLADNELSMNDVDMGEKDSSKEVVEMDGTDWVRLHWWQKQLANIIADNFRCYNYMVTGGGKRKMVFMGTEQDAEIATEIFKFATLDIKYQSNQYLDSHGRKSSRSQNNAIKNDYIAGYLSGLKAKFAEQVEKEGWGLVLVKDDEVIERYENLGGMKSESHSRTSAEDNQAHEKGFKDGKNFDHNKKKIG